MFKTPKVSCWILRNDFAAFVMFIIIMTYKSKTKRKKERKQETKKPTTTTTTKSKPKQQQQQQKTVNSSGCVHLLCDGEAEWGLLLLHLIWMGYAALATS